MIMPVCTARMPGVGCRGHPANLLDLRESPLQRFDLLHGAKPRKIAIATFASSRACSSSFTRANASARSRRVSASTIACPREDAILGRVERRMRVGESLHRGARCSHESMRIGLNQWIVRVQLVAARRAVSSANCGSPRRNATSARPMRPSRPLGAPLGGVVDRPASCRLPSPSDPRSRYVIARL